MRNVAGFALTCSSLFIAVVAVMVNSSALFYMGTGLIATIAACRFQAWLACRGLRFERVTPESMHVGEWVTIEILVWSDRKIKRPLIIVRDKLSKRIPLAAVSRSLPIAPAYDFPVRTVYRFRPLRSGTYRWRGLTVVGTDALGLVVHSRDFETPLAEITILPKAVPVQIELPLALGLGISEAQSGNIRGAGLEPWGVRHFVHGDSLRHVHWRSTARTGQLLVKEFEAGSHSGAAFILQQSVGSDVGDHAMSSLELMKGHIVFLAETFLRQGAIVELPGQDHNPSHGSHHERLAEIYEELARIEADQTASVGSGVLSAVENLARGSVLFVAMSIVDSQAPSAFAEAGFRGVQVIPLLYDARFFGSTEMTPATDSSFRLELQAAGVRPIVMPLGVDIA